MSMQISLKIWRKWDIYLKNIIYQNYSHFEQTMSTEKNRDNFQRNNT